MECQYEPNFAMEAGERGLLVEVKAANEMEDPEVQAKAQAAVEWCGHASVFAAEYAEKPWTYLLVPHDESTASATLQGLVARWGKG